MSGSCFEPVQVLCVNRERNTNAGKSEAKWMETDAERMEIDVYEFNQYIDMTSASCTQRRHDEDIIVRTDASTTRSMSCMKQERYANFIDT